MHCPTSPRRSFRRDKKVSPREGDTAAKRPAGCRSHRQKRPKHASLIPAQALGPVSLILRLAALDRLVRLFLLALDFGSVWSLSSGLFAIPIHRMKFGKGAA